MMKSAAKTSVTLRLIRMLWPVVMKNAAVSAIMATMRMRIRMWTRMRMMLDDFDDDEVVHDDSLIVAGMLRMLMTMTTTTVLTPLH